MRTGLVQLVYTLVAVALGLLVPKISFGTMVDSRRTTEMLVAVGAAFVPFIGIVYSLLFLVVQFGTTTFTPRLNLFRDSPIVWHGFSFFTSVIVFAFTAAFGVGKHDQTSVAVPIIVMVVVLAAIAVFRALQTSAFRSIQLAPTLSAVGQRGRSVIAGVYPDQLTTAPDAAGRILWRSPPATLQIIDVPALVRCAERHDVRIELCTHPGQVLEENGCIATVHGEGEVADDEVLRTLQTGIERTFDQDPAMALRVLTDIALRTLSPAVNDPTSAVQALDEIDDLLRQILRRDLGVETVTDAGGTPRLTLHLPTWDDYVAVALDEIIAIAGSSWQVRRRVDRLLADLIEMAPAGRKDALQTRVARTRAYVPDA